jgi:hypothetical protein
LNFWFQHSQMNPMFHHQLQCDWEIHCHHCGITLKKSKLKPSSAFCVHPWVFSESILHKTCDSLACDNLVENKIITHYRCPTTSLFIMNIYSSIFEHSSSWTFFHPSLNILHYCLTVPSLMMEFHSTHVLSVKKADFAAGGIINCRTHNSLCRDKNKH